LFFWTPQGVLIKMKLRGYSTFFLNYFIHQSCFYIYSHHLESSFIIDPERALMQSDLFIVLHDISSKWTQKTLSPKVMRLLHLYPEKQSILVLNKVDKVKEKRKLLDISQKLTCGIIGGQTIQTTKTPSKVIKSQSKKITFDELASAVSGEKCDTTENIVEDMKVETAMQRRKWTDKEIEMAIKDQVGWPHFSNLFMISALENDGTADVRVSINCS
jgi:GTPase